jgi:regulatory protein
VDDEAFARQVVEHELTMRRSGRRAVLGRLLAAGVERETVDRVLGDVSAAGEEGRALELARARARRLGGVRPDQAFGRLVAFLARRGYDPETARRAARTALQVEPDG